MPIVGLLSRLKRPSSIRAPKDPFAVFDAAGYFGSCVSGVYVDNEKYDTIDHAILQMRSKAR